MSKNFPPRPPRNGSHFPQDYDDGDDLETISLTDDQGRSLDCYIECEKEYGDYTYFLLQPIDLPIIILGWDDEYEDENEDEDISEAIFIEDEEELAEIFGDAKAVLGELNLTLKHTAFTLTASGELPPLEEEDILTLEIDDNCEETTPEELQYLASFYHEEEKYQIYTPLAPLMFFARQTHDGDLELISPENEQIQPILEELLFDELD
jgi:hypothetical protein